MFVLTQNRSFQRGTSEPISWLGTEETKPNTTKTSNTGINRSWLYNSVYYCRNGDYKVNYKIIIRASYN